MGYKKGVVFFIDVLGTKNRGFDDNYHIAEVFHSEMKNVQERHRKTAVVDRGVFSFSDCAYIVYALKDEYQNDDNYKNRVIYNSLFNTAWTILLFLSEGFLCRGGVAYGDVYFDLTNNIIFGPAVNSAYCLESKKAIYPNIILEKNLASCVLEYVEKLGSQMKKRNGDIILLNENNEYHYLNYLNLFHDVSLVSLPNRSYSFDKLYSEAIKMADDEIMQNPTDERIVEKLQWQKEYLNKFKEKLESEENVFDPLSLIRKRF